MDQNKKLWAWGRNTFGVVGIGGATTDDFASPIAICSQKTFCQIAFKRNVAMAIDNYGQAWGWGLNQSQSSGAVGNNSAGGNVITPVQVYGNKTFCKISVHDHTLAIDKNGKGWAWGSNRQWQGGYAIATPPSGACTPVAIAGSKTFCEISAGGPNGLALDQNGKIWAWGEYYLLGTQELVDSRANVGSPILISHAATFCKIFCGSRFATAIDKNGYLWTWGLASTGIGNGQILSASPVLVNETIKFSHLTEYGAISESGQIYAWGATSYGTLGDGAYGRFFSSSRTALPLNIPNTTFCAIAKSDSLAAALDSQGRTWAWGRDHTKIGNLTFNEVTPVRVYNI